jgi:hypothetical protein
MEKAECACACHTQRWWEKVTGERVAGDRVSFTMSRDRAKELVRLLENADGHPCKDLYLTLIECWIYPND